MDARTPREAHPSTARSFWARPVTGRSWARHVRLGRRAGCAPASGGEPHNGEGRHERTPGTFQGAAQRIDPATVGLHDRRHRPLRYASGRSIKKDAKQSPQRELGQREREGKMDDAIGRLSAGVKALKVVKTALARLGAHGSQRSGGAGRPSPTDHLMAVRDQIAGDCAADATVAPVTNTRMADLLATG